MLPNIFSQNCTISSKRQNLLNFLQGAIGYEVFDMCRIQKSLVPLERNALHTFGLQSRDLISEFSLSNSQVKITRRMSMTCCTLYRILIKIHIKTK